MSPATANDRHDAYHCQKGTDSVDRLDHAFSTKVLQATIGSAEVMLRAP